MELDPYKLGQDIAKLTIEVGFWCLATSPVWIAIGIGFLGRRKNGPRNEQDLPPVVK